jgi:hypothetical protein
LLIHGAKSYRYKASGSLHRARRWDQTDRRDGALSGKPTGPSVQ